MAGRIRGGWRTPALAALGLFACLTVGVSQTADAGVATPIQPNIIVVMTDDQPPGMMRALPSVQRLIGDRGATFTNAIASYPLCCPARATFLTGQYAHNHGTLGNNPLSGGGYPALLEPERNLASWLQAAGYETTFAGKWLNGLRTPHAAPPGWNNWFGLVGEGGEGLSSFYDYDVFQGAGLPPRHYGVAPRDYQTDVLARDYALPLIATQATTPEPFFLWLAVHPPHDGLGRDDAAGRRCSVGDPDSRSSKQSAIPAPRHAKRFGAAAAPHPPSFDENDLSDKPEFMRGHEPLSKQDLELIRLNYQCGLAALLAVDDAIRSIVKVLEQTGQLESTVLVFTSDNGALAGEHRVKAGKNRPYEEAIRVPLMISGPLVPAGVTPSGPVPNTDLAPTLLELALARPPAELARPTDGVSQVAALRNGFNEPDRVVLIEGRDNVAPAKHGFKARSYVGVRTERYAYIEHHRGSAPTKDAAIGLPIGAGPTTDVELYDLERDPYELESAHRDRAYVAARRTLARLTRLLEHCSGAACAITATVPGPAR